MIKKGLYKKIKLIKPGVKVRKYRWPSLVYLVVSEFRRVFSNDLSESGIIPGSYSYVIIGNITIGGDVFLEEKASRTSGKLYLRNFKDLRFIEILKDDKKVGV